MACTVRDSSEYLYNVWIGDAGSLKCNSGSGFSCDLAGYSGEGSPSNTSTKSSVLSSVALMRIRKSCSGAKPKGTKRVAY